MKKFKLIIKTSIVAYAIVAFMFYGCENQQKTYNKQPTIYSNEQTADIKIYIIDSCEYIGKLRGYKTDVLTHKGNCKFCVERNTTK